MTAAPGRVTGFLGRNGAGKSTTLRCLLGLSRPEQGRLLVDGVEFARLPRPALRVGALLDSEAHHPGRTAREHLRILATAADLPASRVEEVLGMVELSSAADRRVRTYSLGMRQRLHLGAALLGDPPALVLDEPTNGLDPPGIRWLRDLLRSLAAEGRTVLLSSHVLGEVAQTVDDVVVIAAGRVVMDGTLAELLAQQTRPRVEVRTPSPDRLRDLLRQPARIVSDREGWWTVAGVTCESLARLALEHRLLLTGLRESEANLEDAFLRLTTPEGAPGHKRASAS